MDRRGRSYILLDPIRGPRRVTRRRFYHVTPTEANTGEWVELQREAKRVEDRIDELEKLRDVKSSVSGLGSK